MLVVSDSGPGVMSVFGQRVCVCVCVLMSPFSGNVKARWCDARGLIQQNQEV